MEEALIKLAQSLQCLEAVQCIGYANHANLARAMELISSAHQQISSEKGKGDKDELSSSDAV